MATATITRIDQQPPRALSGREPRILKLDNAAPLRQRVGIEVAPHVPHQQLHIEMLQ